MVGSVRSPLTSSSQIFIPKTFLRRSELRFWLQRYRLSIFFTVYVLPRTGQGLCTNFVLSRRGQGLNTSSLGPTHRNYGMVMQGVSLPEGREGGFCFPSNSYIATRRVCARAQRSRRCSSSSGSVKYCAPRPELIDHLQIIPTS